MLPISVCIPVLNEEKNLPGCLESLKGKFSDVVIVDSGSSDTTLSIAEKANLTVLNFKWNGAFP
ncbi:MAG: glycosyltransferase, partial [Verrucomicrobiaceae bacterium]|nr:glycosyltransferase [Verrucomicrobiaceae bacterium]